MPRPLVQLAVALMAGIITGYNSAIPHIPLLVILTVIFLLLPIMIRKNMAKTIFFLSLIAVAVLGILAISIPIHNEPGVRHIVHRIGEDKLALYGIVSSAPEAIPEGQTIIVDVRNIITHSRLIPVEGVIMLSVRINYPLNYGDLIRFRSRLRKPHNFNNPGSFNYEKYLRGQGILVQGVITVASDIVLIRKECGNPLRTRLETIRDTLRMIIAENAPTPQREILQALLLGEMKEIPQEIREDFNRTGTSHILSISGLHVGMVAACSIALTLLIMKTSSYALLRFNAMTIARFIALIPIIIYAFIAGLGTPVIRSTIMILAFLTALLLRRERDMFNALALAALLILLVNPAALFDISFQLSFAAVASLIFTSPLLTNLFPERHQEEISWPLMLMRKALRALILLMLVSLSATLGSLPLIVRSFNGISTVSLIANVLVVPLMGIVTLAIGMVAILSTLISPALSGFLVHVTSLTLIPSLAVVKFLSSLPFAYLTVTTPTVLEIGMYYLLLISLVLLIKRSQETRRKEQNKTRQMLLKGLIALSLAFFILDILYLSFEDNFRSRLQVTAIDVGQGSSTLVRLPGGKDILIDGGGSATGNFDMGRYVLAPYLWHQRISRLAAVVLTHPHPDHLQGLLYVMDKFPIGEIWTSGYGDEDALYSNFLARIREKGIPHRILGKGTAPITIDGVAITILNPPPVLPHREKRKAAGFDEMNDRSLVIRLTFGNISILLPGDISGATEHRLLTEGTDIASDVLFVAHHGGFSSTTRPFLNAVKPRTAVISCGKGNVFRLPHDDVLKRFASLAARIYRTDRDGAVSIFTDGSVITIQTAKGE